MLGLQALYITIETGGLLHHPFTFTAVGRKSTLCCTFPRITTAIN